VWYVGSTPGGLSASRHDNLSMVEKRRPKVARVPPNGRDFPTIASTRLAASISSTVNVCLSSLGKHGGANAPPRRTCRRPRRRSLDSDIRPQGRRLAPGRAVSDRHAHEPAGDCAGGVAGFLPVRTRPPAKRALPDATEGWKSGPGRRSRKRSTRPAARVRLGSGPATTRTRTAAGSSRSKSPPRREPPAAPQSPSPAAPPEPPVTGDAPLPPQSASTAPPKSLQ
jgi:hypothetical protein